MPIVKAWETFKIGMFAVRIEDFSVSMSSEYSFLKSYTKDESLRVWVGGRGPDSEGRESAAGQLADVQVDMLELVGTGKNNGNPGEKPVRGRPGGGVCNI